MKNAGTSFYLIDPLSYGCVQNEFCEMASVERAHGIGFGRVTCNIKYLYLYHWFLQYLMTTLITCWLLSTESSCTESRYRYLHHYTNIAGPPGTLGDTRPLTCYYWYHQGSCALSDENCQYEHRYTGLVARPPGLKYQTYVAPSSEEPRPWLDAQALAANDRQYKRKREDDDSRSKHPNHPHPSDRRRDIEPVKREPLRTSESGRPHVSGVVKEEEWENLLAPVHFERQKTPIYHRPGGNLNMEAPYTPYTRTAFTVMPPYNGPMTPFTSTTSGGKDYTDEEVGHLAASVVAQGIPLCRSRVLWVSSSSPFLIDILCLHSRMRAVDNVLLGGRY